MDYILTILSGSKTIYKNSSNKDIYKCFVKLNNTNLVSGVFTNCNEVFPKNRISTNNPYNFNYEKNISFDYHSIGCVEFMCFAKEVHWIRRKL